MKELLKDIINSAYVPLSNFKVACIIEGEDHNLYKGVNVEHESLNDGLCAEQVALGEYFAEGGSKIIKIHIYNTTKNFIPPCFLCRQYLSEYAKGAEVILYNEKGKEMSLTLDSLTPMPFSEKDWK